MIAATNSESSGSIQATCVSSTRAPADDDRKRTERVARDVQERRPHVQVVAGRTRQGDAQPEVDDDTDQRDAQHDPALRQLRAREAAQRLDDDQDRHGKEQRRR